MKGIWGFTDSTNTAADFHAADDIQKHLQCSSIMAQLLWKRGFHTKESVDRLLNPQLAQLPSPFSIIDMEKAVGRVIDALANEELIAVYGDYDVDGTCGAALLTQFLEELGASVVTYQPNRFTEGYGMNTPAVEKLIGQGARVVISVDCGITAVEQAKACAERGCDLIVLDHHLPGPKLPQALAVVDPQREEDSSGLQNLCGAGLAFFFAIGMRQRLREAGFFEECPEPNLVKYLDLVASATIADLADLRGVNRILVSHGMRVLNKNPRVGLKAILDAASVTKLKSYHLGFVVGPRINAAGRLASAQAALELLTCSDEGKARDLARQLEEINKARRETQDGVLQEARVAARQHLEDPRWKQLAENHPAASFGPWPRALVLANEHWHEGVLGIVASKIVEEFGRPTFILSKKEGSGEDGTPVILKGSARSISKVDIFAVLQTPSVSGHLLNFGGHAHAGGASLLQDELWAFTEAMNVHLALTTNAETFRREHRFDLEIDPSQVTPRLWTQVLQELESLEPFGMKFPEPVFKVTGCKATDIRILKEKHQKFKVEGIDALWFNSIEADPESEKGPLAAGDKLAVWVSPQWNEWQGVKRLQFRISHCERIPNVRDAGAASTARLPYAGGKPREL